MRWRREVRGALERALGRPRPELGPDWRDLIDRVSGRLGGHGGRHAFRRTVLKTLAQAAADKGLGPDRLSQEAFEGILARAVSGGQRKAIRRAAKILTEYSILDPAFACPVLALPPPLSKRRQTPSLMPRLAAEIDEAIEARRFRRFRGVRRRLGGISQETAKHNRNGINWLISSADALGLVDLASDPGLGAFATEEVVAGCTIAQMDGAFPWSDLAPSSLRGYLKSAVQFLTVHNPEIAMVRNRLLDDQFFESADGMSPARRAWCEMLVTTPGMAQRFLGLPNRLFTEAKDRWSAFPTMTALQQQQTLALCGVTAAAGLLLSLPLRAQTLLASDVEGADPEIALSSVSGMVIVNIPAALTKNKRAIGPVELIPKPGGSPYEIVSWFLDGPREVLLAREIDQGKGDEGFSR